MRYCLIIALSMLAITGCTATMSDVDQAEASSAPYHQYVETIGVAKAAGYDYEKLVDRCLAKDKQALHDLFQLTKTAGFDAASAQGNAAVLEMLLRSLGDEFFAECLTPEPTDVRREIYENVQYALGESREVSSDFPETYAACFTVAERVEHIVDACRREVHGWQPQYAVAEMGKEAVPALLSMMNDQRKVWVRIGAPTGGPEGRFVDVKYLWADDEGPRNSVAEFALLCICIIREPKSGYMEDFTKIWDPVMHEFTDYDGKVTAETIAEIKTWYEIASGGGVE